MSVCSVKAPNGQPSILHNNLFRHYNAVMETKESLNDYVLADWVNTRTGSFNQEHDSVFKDSNNEPMPFYIVPSAVTMEETGVPDTFRAMEDLSDDEIKLYAGNMNLSPVYLTEEGVSIPAVRYNKPLPVTSDPIQLTDITDQQELPLARIKAFAGRLNKQFNIPVTFVTAEQAAYIFYEQKSVYKGEPGFVADNRYYLVEGRAGYDTAIHEVFGHPFLELLEKRQPDLFSQLAGTVMTNESIVSYIKKNYPQHTAGNGLNNNGIKEAILYAMQLDMAGRTDTLNNSESVKNLISRFWNWLKNLFRIPFEEFSMNSATSVKALIDAVLDGKSTDLSMAELSGLHRSASSVIGSSVRITPLTQEELDEYLKENVDFFGKGKGTPLQTEHVKKIMDSIKDIEFITDPREGSRYRYKSDHSKKIDRGTEIIDRRLGMYDIEKTDMEYAENVATAIFIKQNISQPSLTSTAQVNYNDKPYTYKQLIYEVLRDSTYRRMLGVFRHKLMEYAFNPTDENFKQIEKLSLPILHPDDKSIVIFKGISNWQREFDTWLKRDPQYPDYPAPIETIREMFNLNTDTAAVVLTEQILSIPQLNIATTADLLMVYPNGEYGILDYKFSNLQGGKAGNLMKYTKMPTTRENLAIMQVILRMMAVKLANPNAKFRMAAIARLMERGDRIEEIPDFQWQPYMDGIKEWIREDYPQQFKEFEEKKLFTSNEYWGTSRAAIEFMEERLEKGKAETAEEKLSRDYRDPDVKLATATEMIISLSAKIKRLTGDRRYEQAIVKWKRELAEISKVYFSLQYTGINPEELYAFKDDTSWALMANMNKYDQTNPGIQAITRLGNRREVMVDKKLDDQRKVHKVLIDKVIEEHRKKTGMTKISVFDKHVNINAADYYKGNGSGVYDFMYVEEPLDGKTVMRFTSKTRDAEKWNKMTKAQQDYHHYVTTTMKNAYNKSVGERKMILFDGEPQSKAKLLGLQEQWDDNNAMVYIPIKSDEMKERGIDFIDRFKKGYFNMFYTGDYSDNQNKQAGMPVKYMSMPQSVRTEKMHSLDIQHVFERFTEHMYNIEAFEDLYAAANGMIAAMDLHNMTQGKKTSSLQKWLEDYTSVHILKEAPEEQEIVLKISRGKEGEAQKLTLNKIGEAMRNLTTYTTIGLSPVLSTSNFLLTTMINWKTAGTNELARRLHGAKVSFGVNELFKGTMSYLNMKKDMAMGNEDNNKLYQFIKKYKLTPSDMKGMTAEEDIAYSKQNVISSSTLMTMQMATENWALITMLAAIMHNTTYKRGGKDVSLMDSYKIVDRTDPVSNVKYKDIDWVGGIRGVVKTPLAGDIEGGKDRLTEITDLTAEEINSIKRMSVELTGDYRKDEKTPADSMFWWQMAAQFKRFLRRYIINAFAGRKEDPALGRFIETGEPVKQDDGTERKELVWMKEVTQGWINLFAHQMLTWLMYASPDTFKKIALSCGKSEEWVNTLQAKYKWSELSDHQKAAFYKGAVNAALIMAAFILTPGWQDDDDPLKRRLKGTFSDLTEGMNFTDLVSSFKYTMPSLNKMSKFMTSGFTLLSSTITQDYTKEGNLRGAADFANMFGPSASYRQIKAIMDTWENY